MIPVACVLRSGGAFAPEWVRALRRQVSARHPTYSLTCLTDQPSTVIADRVVPLRHDWPGWWSKIELFQPGLFREGERILYLDLDTVVTGDLSEIAAYAGAFAMLRDFGNPDIVASGVMAWTPSPETERIYHEFVALGHVPRGRSDFWYAEHVPPPDLLQDLFPGQIESLKRGARGEPPEDARLVCGHGRPRLSDPAAGWAHEMWKEYAE